MTTKICHLTSAHNSLDDRIFEKECVSLAQRKDYDVYIVAQGQDMEKDNVHIKGIGYYSSGRMDRMTKVAKDVYKKALEIDADIYHFHDPELLFYGLKLKKKGKIVIYDSHENYYQQIQEKYYIPKIVRSLVANSYRAFETGVVKNLDAVIFPCLIKDKHPFEGRCKKILLVDNLPSRKKVLSKYDPNKKKALPNTVCYTGGLTEERGITNLVKGCYKAGAKLILAGEFSPEEYHHKLMEMEEFSCVDYRGLCTREEVIGIFNESSIGANILQNKGQYPFLANLSTKVYEFMAFELPVVINDYEYGRKMVEEYGFGLTANPDNVDDIAEKISYLIDNPDIAKNMGLKGRLLVEEKLNWDIEAEKLFNLYDQLYDN
jgi:glycosyltransferase involved in cell wall biosynthesis